MEHTSPQTSYAFMSVIFLSYCLNCKRCSPCIVYAFECDQITMKWLMWKRFCHFSWAMGTMGTMGTMGISLTGAIINLTVAFTSTVRFRELTFRYITVIALCLPTMQVRTNNDAKYIKISNCQWIEILILYYLSEIILHKEYWTMIYAQITTNNLSITKHFHVDQGLIISTVWFSVLVRHLYFQSVPSALLVQAIQFPIGQPWQSVYLMLADSISSFQWS